MLKRVSKKARRSRVFKRVFLSILIIFPFVMASLGFYIFMIIRELPDVHSLKDYRPSITTRIYGENDRVIDEFFLEDRRLIAIAKLPKYVTNAFVAAEDSRFFQHKGIDFQGMLRAFVKNLEHGAIVQGGSTITQQVAKSFYLSSERTMGRKFREIILAYRINKNLKKYEILNLYLNQIYLGHGTYGIEAASYCYFGKSAAELHLAEAAMLAGLPKAPSRYSPFVSMEKAAQRQAYVLTRMVEEGYITESQKEAASKARIRLNTSGPKGKVAPYFTENVRRYILSNYGSDILYKEGLEVYTTLNADLQRAANAAVDRGLRELEAREGYRATLKRIPKNRIDAFLKELDSQAGGKPFEKGQTAKAVVEDVSPEQKLVFLRLGTSLRAMAEMEEEQKQDRAEPAGARQPSITVRVGDVVNVKITEKNNQVEARYRVAIQPRNVVQAALVCMDARTGEIKAMVGGRDFSSSEFNRATQARRQPGSAFKPLIYTAAFDKGLTPATVMVDEPLSFPDPYRGEWRPQNADRKFGGPTSLRSAVIHSRNIITIKVLQQIGVDYAADYAANMGITSPITRNLSLALGTSGVTVQEMARAFGVLANEGRRVEPFFIRKIVDRTGNVFEHHEPKVEQVIDPKIAFLTTSILQEAVQRGTGYKAKIAGRPVAGKTGTTDDQKDAWFVGYTPSLVTAVWVGFDDSKPLGRGEMGGVAAAPIWAYFMEKALAGKPVENFEVPPGIVVTRIDPKTGRPAGLLSDGVNEFFLEGTGPGNQHKNESSGFWGSFRQEP